MKRVLAVLTAAIMLLTFAGCDDKELGLYQTIKGLSALDTFTFEGKVDLTINKLEDLSAQIEGASDDAPAVETYQQTLDKFKALYGGAKLIYSGAMNAKDATMSLNLSFETANTASNFTVKIYAEGSMLYINKATADKLNLDSMIENIFDIDTYTYATETKDGVEYVAFDMKEYINLVFDLMKERIPEISAVAPYHKDKSEAYNCGYKDGFHDATNDFEDDATKTNGVYVYGCDGTQYQSNYYNDMDQTEIAAFKVDYKVGYDAAYPVGTAASVAEAATDQTALASLDTLKPAMLEKANVTYFINTFKSIVLKGTDGIVKQIFDNCTLGLVTKSGDSKYTLSFGTDDVISVLGTLAAYVNDTENLKKVIPALNNIVNSLTDEELMMFTLTPSDRTFILNEITWLEPLMGDIATGDLSPLKIQVEAPVLEENMDYSFSIEKTGSVSYELSDTITIENMDVSDLLNRPESISSYTPSKADPQAVCSFDIKNSISINKVSKGNIETTPTPVATTQNGATITLDVDDSNAVECGILYSTSATDFSNAIRVKAIKQANGTYAVSLSSLSSGTTYYYKTYTLDAADNLVYSSEVVNLKTLAVAANPATGDATPVALMVVSLGALTACFTSLKKKSVSTK